MNNYCPEIKETLKGCKELVLCNRKVDDYICRDKNLCPICISKLQTHLIHAEKDLIDVEKDIMFLESFCSNDILNYSYSVEVMRDKINQKQLRKTEIEEAIKLCKEGLK